MSNLMRTKQVTNPLDNKIKAMMICEYSSGSEHAGDDSPSLSDLVQGFIFGNESTRNEIENESDSEKFEDSTYPVITMRNDPFRNSLLAHVRKAMEMFSCIKTNKSAFLRSLMGYLRDIGYNAAICKTKWESSGGITAGSHEFIDLVTSHIRYFIEIDFLSEFEIARPSESYERVLNTLPRVFIGTQDELKKIVKGMSDFSRRSLKSQGLSIPPWRKNRFMQNKWVGSYKRTTNLVPLNTPFPSPAKGCYSVKCRSVGFNAVNGGLVSQAMTRTR